MLAMYTILGPVINNVGDFFVPPNSVDRNIYIYWRLSTELSRLKDNVSAQ